MAYFPLFVELAGRRVLVVGGRRVALRKVEKLLPYEPEVVVAPEIRPELENLQGVTLVCRSFSRICCPEPLWSSPLPEIQE